MHELNLSNTAFCIQFNYLIGKLFKKRPDPLEYTIESNIAEVKLMWEDHIPDFLLGSSVPRQICKCCSLFVYTKKKKKKKKEKRKKKRETFLSKFINLKEYRTMPQKL